jgi:ABC-type nickel/cobalt efflux system permease component RcnA
VIHHADAGSVNQGMEQSLVATLMLGFGLGLQHSLDADHLVAVSTLVGRGRSLSRSAAVGALWGLGHTAALLVAAGAVVALRLTISPRVADALETCVGVMLIVLGGDLLVRALRGELRVHSHPHVHQGGMHRHLHVHVPPVATHEHAHDGPIRRPFLVGVVHGLAGSAAVMLAVLGTIGNAWSALLYVLIFGCGTVIGMLALSTVLGVPFVLGARGPGPLANRLQLVVGLGAVAFGVSHAWRALPIG